MKASTAMCILFAAGVASSAFAAPVGKHTSDLCSVLQHEASAAAAVNNVLVFHFVLVIMHSMAAC